MTSNSFGKSASVISQTSLSEASKNLCLKSLHGYPPYKNDGSKRGNFVNAASIPSANILQPVCCCKYLFPPIWSALECVLIIPFKLQPFSFNILRTFCLRLYHFRCLSDRPLYHLLYKSRFLQGSLCNNFFPDLI